MIEIASPDCADRLYLVSDLPLLSVSFSSPKSKQEVMVRPPTVMSPSGNPQLDSKFSNQGKQGAQPANPSHPPVTPRVGAIPLKHSLAQVGAWG